MTDFSKYSEAKIIGIGIMTGTTTLIASIVKLLEEKGVVEPDLFVSALDEGIKQAEADAQTRSDLPKNWPRYDMMIFRATADILRHRKGKGWKPVVIQGGLSDESPHEEN